ncbi:MAG: hypothetical protein R2853_08590 [Thermomicrobiales bacterium]
MACSRARYDWEFAVQDGVLTDGGHPTLVVAVAPTTSFAFSKGEPLGQTRWQFAPDAP